MGALNAAAIPAMGTLNAAAIPAMGTLNAAAIPAMGTLNAAAIPAMGTLNAAAIPAMGTKVIHWYNKLDICGITWEAFIARSWFHGKVYFTIYTFRQVQTCKAGCNTIFE